MSLLLLDYAGSRRLAVLNEDGRPRLRPVPLLTRRAKKGEFLRGWYQGRLNFFAVYYDARQLWIATRRTRCVLHPATREETVSWRGDGPVAELRIERDGRELLRHRYLRRLRYVLEDEEFPEHDLPQWLHRMWMNPEVDFKHGIAADGLFRV